MQFFALDRQTPILATHAQKGKDYACPECGHPVRLRSGPHRQAHYFHVQLVPSCRQHQKSAEHLQTQLRLLALLPQGEGSLERPFPSISRIADVVWEPAQIVFEIQCSSISRSEVEARTADYRSLGMSVVWILHDNRFNQRRLSAAEHLVRKQPCYYTNISSTGFGIFYDQFEVIKGAIRSYRGPPLPIFLHRPLPIHAQFTTSSVELIAQRASFWSLSFEGDLLHRFCTAGGNSLNSMKALEKKFHSSTPLPFNLFLAFKRLYALLFDGLVRSCAKR